MTLPRFRYVVRAEPIASPGYDQVVAEIVGTHSVDLVRRAQRLLPSGFDPKSVMLELMGTADG